jgi:hypothetical protein
VFTNLEAYTHRQVFNLAIGKIHRPGKANILLCHIYLRFAKLVLRAAPVQLPNVDLMDFNVPANTYFTKVDEAVIGLRVDAQCKHGIEDTVIVVGELSPAQSRDVDPSIFVLIDCPKCSDLFVVLPHFSTSWLFDLSYYTVLL